MVTLGNDVTIILVNFVVKQNEILLIQESKESCYGKWYLPAGRLEANETLIQGAKRECLEESGYKVELDGIFLIELPSPSWVRITFLGRVVGGTLKNKPDGESLKASWFPLEVVLNGGDDNCKLRARDVCKLARKWLSLQKPIFSELMPTERPHTEIIVELIINVVIDGDMFQLVTCDKNSFPRIKRSHSFCEEINQFIKKELHVTRNVYEIWSGALKVTSVEFDSSTTQKCYGMLLQISLPIITDPVVLCNESRYTLKLVSESRLECAYNKAPHPPIIVEHL